MVQRMTARESRTRQCTILSRKRVPSQLRKYLHINIIDTHRDMADFGRGELERVSFYGVIGF